MERYRFGRVVVKVGSNVLTRDDGTLDTTRMSALSDQIAQLHRGGVEIILVSSGAVAAGRSELGTERKLDSVSARQLFSAVGQVKLINRYYELMRDRGIRADVHRQRRAFGPDRGDDGCRGPDHSEQYRRNI